MLADDLEMRQEDAQLADFVVQLGQSGQVRVLVAPRNDAVKSFRTEAC